MDAQYLFPGPLAPVYDALRTHLLALDRGVIEEFKKTQVSYGLTRKFAWLSPLTKTKALLVIDMWDQHDEPMIRGVIRDRPDKFIHQIEVRTSDEIDAVARLGWFEEAAAWGRKDRPNDAAS